MTRIQVLPDDLINQIAAGEVVERPASVVKELVENALDAEATHIRIAIAEGGVRAIDVTDDGVGMGRADAELAFRRHATSKLRSPEDLGRIATLGFRGEALPSIASVARIRMRTRVVDAATGWELSGQGQGIDTVREVACPVGTRVEVGELFGRVPARRKFLKASQTESSHITRWLERIALVRPDVRFDLDRDNKPVARWLATGDVRERARAVLPPAVGADLIEVDGEVEWARLTGFVTPTHTSRGTTHDIHVFVNARPVRDRGLLAAVRLAYRDALPPGRFPACVLFLQIDPGEVDVNVHPAKLEVRFREARAVSDFVRRSVARAAAEGTTAGVAPRSSASGAASGRSRAEVFDTSRPAGDWVLAATTPSLFDRDAPVSVTAGVAPYRFRSLRYIGQALGTYLLLEADGQLVLIDQHASHERVLFERLRQELFRGKLDRESLLVPLRVELASSDAEALEGALDRLEGAGLELELGGRSVTGACQVIVRAMPSVLAARNDLRWEELLAETAGALRDPELCETREGLDDAFHGILATAACHAAVRKGDRLDRAGVEGLLEALDDTLWFPNCPHGRPIFAVIAEGELERRFLRR